jgi:hypothetical protein
MDHTETSFDSTRNSSATTHGKSGDFVFVNEISKNKKGEISSQMQHLKLGEDGFTSMIFLH